MTEPEDLMPPPVRLQNRRNAGEMVWGVASQAGSSLTNFGLSLVAARSLGPEGLGVLFVGYSFYLVLLGLMHALLSDPLVAITTTLNHDDRRAAQRSALSIVVLVSIGVAALVALAGLLLPDPAGLALLVFAPWLIPALLQDFWRTVLFQQKRGRAGAINDLCWVVVMAATVPLAFRIGELWAVVACWGLGAAAGCIVGLFQTRLLMVGDSHPFRWWRTTVWPMGRWLGLESVVGALGTQILVFVFAFVLGPASLGGLRSVQSVYAPLGLVGNALTLPAFPELAHRLRESPSGALRYALRLGLLAGGLTAGYIALAAAAGGDLLVRVFGSDFLGYQELVIPVGTSQLVAALFIGFPLVLKALRQGRDLLISALLSSVVMLVVCTLLAMSGGIVAAAWGLALGAAVRGLLRAWLAIRRTSLPAD